ncbi:zymogen granule membrane protein 16-like [Embiotoca jacksoni]|uniref:zymogen granule membrane protein 16-like n=1 Tax=Embiotoca jacksoni TaxID=100190 RepID=UPI003703BD8C
MADVQPQYYSFSPPVGTAVGSPYFVIGDGRITAIRVWEAYNRNIKGFQFRYGFVWSPVAGYRTSRLQELKLFDGETIVQISGKYAYFLQTVAFVTNRGRSLFVGQPHGYSYNMYPTNNQAELRFISGRSHGSITSIGAHWALVDPVFNNTTGH